MIVELWSHLKINFHSQRILAVYILQFFWREIDRALEPAKKIEKARRKDQVIVAHGKSMNIKFHVTQA
jgi:hypothetical protein